jgi:hypothetical protein
MKVVIIGPAHPLRGGLASYNERLAKEFADNGHTVSIYTLASFFPVPHNIPPNRLRQILIYRFASTPSTLLTGSKLATG